MTSVVGSNVVMRWQKNGWQLGRITGIITNATPHKNFILGIIWADGSNQGVSKA